MYLSNLFASITSSASAPWDESTNLTYISKEGSGVAKKPLVVSWGRYEVAYDLTLQHNDWCCPNCSSLSLADPRAELIGFSATAPIPSLAKRSFCAIYECKTCQAEFWAHVDKVWLDVRVADGNWPEELVEEVPD